MTLIIDNYDSFTYNLYQYLCELGEKCKVVRNDKFDVDQVLKRPPERILISPGPGKPENAGFCVELIQKSQGKVPILGICLGHQAIAQAFGGNVIRAKQLMHGKLSEVYHQKKGVFRGLATPMTATRYHSLVVERKSLPSCLEVTAVTEGLRSKSGLIMGLRHKKFPIEGVQFHPESFSTENGHHLLKEFLKRRTKK